jgi:hypothetical protein
VKDKKTILFFSRMGLTHLFGSIDKLLKNEYNIVHVAYSDTEYAILNEKYNIKPDYNLVQYMEEEQQKGKYDIDDITTLSNIIEEYSENNFTLNSAIISDQRGLNGIPQDDAYLMSYYYYKFWGDVLTSTNCDIVFHETVTHIYNFILSVLSKKQGIIYSGFFTCMGEYKYNFRFTEFDGGDSIILKKYINDKVDDRKNIIEFIEKTKHKKQNLEYRKKEKLFITFLKIAKGVFKKVYKKYQSRHIDRLVNANEYYVIKNDAYLKNAIRRVSYKFLLKYDKINNDDKYYFYPLHYEPEASLSYWEAGKFSQIDLIEKMARQIPVGAYLYVKDHPEHDGYRDLSDYHKIKKLPNVKLLDSLENGIDIIKGSIALISISGTAIYEASVFGKPVYMLGNIYYKYNKNITLVKDVNDLSKLWKDDTPQYNKENLNIFVNSYLKSTYEGDVWKFFINYKSMDCDKSNTKVVALSFGKYIQEVLKS